MTHISQIVKSQLYIFLTQNDSQYKVTREASRWALSRCQGSCAGYLEEMSLCYLVTPIVHAIQMLESLFILESMNE